MSEGLSGHGTIIAWQATPGGAFTDIAELASDIVPPPFSRNEIENTIHNDDIDSYILGVLRRGTAPFTINFLKSDASHSAAAGLLHAIIVNLKTGFRFTFPDASIWIFSGGVSQFSLKAPNDGPYQAEVALRATGRMIIDAVTVGD